MTTIPQQWREHFTPLIGVPSTPDVGFSLSAIEAITFTEGGDFVDVIMKESK